MNIIHRLRAEAAEKDAEIAALRAGLEEFRIYLLTSPKFGNRRLDSQAWDGQGAPPPLPPLPTGERLDWISTGEAVDRLRTIEAAGFMAALEAA